MLTIISHVALQFQSNVSMVMIKNKKKFYCRCDDYVNEFCKKLTKILQKKKKKKKKFKQRETKGLTAGEI